MEDVVSVSIQVNQPSMSQQDMLNVQIHYSDTARSGKIQPETSIESTSSTEVMQHKTNPSHSSNKISSESQAIK